MSSIDDMPEHYREDFEGYEPDSLYCQSAEKMAYFKSMLTSSYPRRYGKNKPPTNEEVLHFSQLLENANSNIKNLTNYDKFSLAWHYEHGINSNLSNITNGQVKPNYKDAIHFYSDIYTEGCNSKEVMAIDAAHQIGVLHEKGGYGIKKDYSIAAEWYVKGIELQNQLQKNIYINSVLGERSSHIALARLYIEGLGVKEDHNKAIKILSKLEIQGDRFPNFNNNVANNEALKYFLFSKIYSFNNNFFATTYGYLDKKNEFAEEGYFMSKNDQRNLWKKWISKAVDLDHIEAIEEYAFGLDQSHFLEYLDPKNKEEFYRAYRDTINSLYYFKKLSQMSDNYHSETYSENLAMTQHSIYKFAIKAQKYDELSKDEK